MTQGGAVWLARVAHNPEVASSNLAPATFNKDVTFVPQRTIWKFSNGVIFEGEISMVTKQRHIGNHKMWQKCRICGNTNMS